MRSTVIVLLAASACLAACNSKPAGNAASGQSAAPAASVAITEDPMPHPKPGLWNIATEMTLDGKNPLADQPGITMPKVQVCIDNTYDASKAWRGRNQASSECAQPTLQRRADGSIALHVTCTPKSGGPRTMDGVISGDFTTTYKVDVTTTSSDGAGTQHTAHMVMTQTRVGDCAPGQKGGSMTFNGQPMPTPMPAPAQ